VNAGADFEVAEGSPNRLAGTATDPGADTLTYAWTIDGNGCTITDAASATAMVTCDDTAGHTATLTVTDGDGGTTIDTAQVTVTNVAPVIGPLTISGGTGTACLAGNATTVAFSVTDAGAADTLGGTVTWGDGTSTTYSGGTVSVTHTYTAGTYAITVGAADDDGGTDSRAAGTDSVQHLFTAGELMAPVNPDGSSVFKIGSTVPLKVAIRDCAGTLVTKLAPSVGLRRLDTTPDGAVNEVVSTSAADTGNLMRFTEDKYLYNLSTKRSQFCTTGVTMCSGSDLTAGTYEVKITDSATNDTFAPVVQRVNLR
jgi:hypothetical protein